MSKRSKVSRNYTPVLTGLLLLLFFITFRLSAKSNIEWQYLDTITNNSDTTILDTIKKTIKDTLLKPAGDTLQKVNDTLPKPSSVINAPDSFFVADSLNGADTSAKVPVIDSMIISKDSLSSPIEYSAEDSGVLIIPTRQFYLYGKANAKNGDIDLTANNIQYDQSTQVIKAFGGIDTANNPLSKPTIVQGGQTTISDTIEFNLQTQRALAKNSYYNEGELYVNADKVKKITKDAAFAYRARFTTCNLDTPHFDIRAKKMKIINNKIAVSGPAYPEFEGVPIPIVIPFGIYPLSRGRHSGLLPIQFTTNESQGLGVEGIGFYKVMNDNWDVTARGNIYTYGGWTLSVNPKYFKRYKYQGNLNLELQNTRTLNSYGFAKDEFSKSRTFNITWSHSQDTKAHPGTTFSASVNAGSTKFNENIPNNPIRNYNNMLQSSISYSKTSQDGKYNLTVSATHNQNSNLRLQNISLPNVSFTVNTIYPFEQKEPTGTPKWYEKLGVGYSGNVRNQFSFYDTAFSINRILDTARFGAEHTIPITLSLPALGPFIVSPNISFSQLWFGDKHDIFWNDAAKRVDTVTQRGFYTASRMSYGVGVNTRIFGTVNFPKSKNIVAIRHEIKPTIGFSYTPDLVGQHFKRIQTDTVQGGHYNLVSDLGNTVYSMYSPGRSGTITFGLDNLLEMKVKNKKDTTGEEPTKKVKLIDGLSINTGYNLLADSLNWSDISINFRTTLLNNKVNVTGNALISPYGVDVTGNEINDLLWKHGSFGRLTNAGFNISTSLQSKSKDGKTQQERIQADETLTMDEQLAELQYVRDNPAEFTDFDIPWTLQLSFAASLSRLQRSNFTYVNQFNSSLNVNGDFSLTPKWKIGGNFMFDVKNLQIGMLTMYITRDMHCWQLSINVTPIGITRSFSIVLNPKSGLLRDLRINRSRYFSSSY
ncbi:LPS-assembly protein LptD [Ilyomonas limi]|uniref:LPS-assembly protein LptD n=1 Tax=Ilyomonas limi TaxID=2575867 RepID=A0A4U3L2M9_9BACT|nr:putative LPS assembly protein LptD [Ilyomonas limi]TKK68509.1 LPS-assembly protein LptD [Ilyomonas limi]